MIKLILSLFLVLLFGCKNFHNPPIAAVKTEGIPDRWQAGKNSDSSSHWLKDFNDQHLPKLVDEAIYSNWNFQASAARLEEAYAAAGIVTADRFPVLNLEGNAARSRSGSGNIRQHSNEYGLFARLNWEIDIWGRLKDREESAKADARSQFYTFQAARLSLAASVSRFWFNAVEAKLQLLLAEETEKSFLNTSEIIDERFKRGISEALDVRLANVDLANARQNTQQRKVNFDEAVRALEVLLGRYPKGEIAVSQTLPEIIENIPLGLPAEMLNRRPDILAALEALQAANFKVSEKKKELLPGISLSASMGNRAESVEDIFNAEKILWNLAGNLSQPILQGGRIQSRIAQAKAREKIEFATLMQLVYDACLEVESAVSAEKFLLEKEKQIAVSVEESQKAFELARDRYSKGLTDIITLLASQRSEFNSRSRLLEVKLQRLLNRLNLYLALGGDFQESISEEN